LKGDALVGIARHFVLIFLDCFCRSRLCTSIPRYDVILVFVINVHEGGMGKTDA